MNSFRHLGCIRGRFAMLLSGCGSPHGQPHKESETLAPNEMSEF